MPVSDAKKKANAKWNASRDNIIDYEAINEHIAKTGESFQAFVNRAVKDTIDRDNQLIKMGLPVQKQTEE